MSWLKTILILALIIVGVVLISQFPVEGIIIIGGIVIIIVGKILMQGGADEN
jgi:hypothetical protein